jgi:hypothetical protein
MLTIFVVAPGSTTSEMLEPFEAVLSLRVIHP